MAEMEPVVGDSRLPLHYKTREGAQRESAITAGGLYRPAQEHMDCLDDALEGFG
jgi:hypothetical protein